MNRFLARLRFEAELVRNLSNPDLLGSRGGTYSYHSAHDPGCSLIPWKKPFFFCPICAPDGDATFLRTAAVISPVGGSQPQDKRYLVCRTRLSVMVRIADTEPREAASVLLICSPQ